eukprot:1158006-Pelagomonas_calceolata.AAC.13
MMRSTQHTLPSSQLARRGFAQCLTGGIRQLRERVVRSTPPPSPFPMTPRLQEQGQGKLLPAHGQKPPQWQQWGGAAVGHQFAMKTKRMSMEGEQHERNK